MIIGSDGQNMELTRIEGVNNAGLLRWVRAGIPAQQIIDFTASQKEFLSVQCALRKEHIKWRTI
jgi:hypothetical protein